MYFFIPTIPMTSFSAKQQEIIENACITAVEILVTEGEEACKAYLEQWCRFPNRKIAHGIFYVLFQYLAHSFHPSPTHP